MKNNILIAVSGTGGHVYPGFALGEELKKHNYNPVYIVNNNNGERFDTYVIRGERGSGCICLNGAAARKVQVGDIVIIMAYALKDLEEAKTFTPKIVFPDQNTNKIL